MDVWRLVIGIVLDGSVSYPNKVLPYLIGTSQEAERGVEVVWIAFLGNESRNRVVIHAEVR